MTDSHNDNSNTQPQQPPTENHQELWWQDKDQPVPIASEKHVLDVLLRRGDKERCMICKQPPHRLRQIQRIVNEAPGLTMVQALSLRRHHIMLRNPGKRPPQLGLGDEESIRKSADIFERTIEDCLVQQGISFLNETQQKQSEDRGIRLTPDFLFSQPVQLVRYRVAKKGGGRQPQPPIAIHWVEAKMFYGASTIPHGTGGAIGTIRAKMERYVNAFGPGAIIFMQGYGDQLAKDLDGIGVTVLSGTSIPRHMIQQVWDHQMTWCANSDGRILP